MVNMRKVCCLKLQRGVNDMNMKKLHCRLCRRPPVGGVDYGHWFMGMVYSGQIIFKPNALLCETHVKIAMDSMLKSLKIKGGCNG